MGFPLLRRPCGPLPHPPLWRTCGQLWRPHVPRRFPALPRIRFPVFPAGLRTSPFSPVSPHEVPLLSPRRRPRRRLSRCRPRQPLRHPDDRSRRFPASPLSLPSAVRRPNLPPPRLLPLQCLPHRQIPHRSIRRFRLRSLLRPLPLRGTPPLLRRCFPDPGGLVSCSPGTSLTLSSSPPRLAARLPFSVPVPPPCSGASPPPSIRLLRPLAPPRAPLPPAPAADIGCKDEDVGDRTGGVVACWSVAGGSAPHRKIPSRPLAVVGDRISFPRFFHRPQQYHPVHCRPALQHLYALADGPVVEQV